MSLNLSSYKGTRDLYPEDMRARKYIFDKWRETVETFGYEEYDAPMLEPVELYAAKSGQEIVNDQTYRFIDRGEREVAIRPEMTPSVARMVAARRQELPMPLRLYSICNYMRYERPQKGREREFWQLNFDLFGAHNVEADIEVINLSHSIVKSFGASDEMFTVKVNDRRLTDFVMRSYLGLDDNQTTQMIKLLDRKDKITDIEFKEQALDIANNNREIVSKVVAYIENNNLQIVAETVGDSEIVEPLRQLILKMTSNGITNIKYDPTLMRGFDYYTGIVFEIFDEAPENRRAMFGGGRYDGLVGLFGVADLPVVGAAPGETMFMEFLKAHNLLPALYQTTNVVVALIGNVDASSVIGELREGGLKVAVDFTDRKIDKKIKAANKFGVEWIIFVGENELQTGKFSVKNLLSGNEETLDASQIISTLAKPNVD